MSDETTTEYYHEDTNRFLEALSHTAAGTGFSKRLIEKDYYCSILLQDFTPLFEKGLVFKGGTSLSKIHIEFFRLSEDLDFGASVKAEASRTTRREAIAPVKNHLTELTNRLPFIAEKVTLSGHNNNSQYNAEFTYLSSITGEQEAIKFEASLREETLLPVENLRAKTALIDPLTGLSVIEPFQVQTLSLIEAYAEKARAALTRREPAIRDYFDIEIAAQRGLIRQDTPEFLALVSQKLRITSDPVNISDKRVEDLRRQLEAQLKPRPSACRLCSLFFGPSNQTRPRNQRRLEQQPFSRAASHRIMLTQLSFSEGS